MKSLLLGLILLLSSATFAQQTNESVVINSVTRNYIQYLPVGFQPSENLPVVFVLHGIGGNGLNMVGAGFNLIADTARFIVIYPDGILNNWGQTSWNNGTILASTADDKTLFNTLMDDLILNLNADPTRIYFTGFSMGGIMSHHMACELNERVAAIGSMSGTMANSDIANCTPAYVTPVIHLHGDADATVPYNTGALPSLSLVPQTMDFWINQHGCAGTYDSIRMPDLAPLDGITVDRFVYLDCNNLNDPLEHWRLNGADHVFLYQPVNDITESFEVWRFFYRFAHPNPASATITELASTPLYVYPNPARDVITIQKSIPNEEVQLMDLSGRILLQTEETTLDLTGITPGNYMIRVGSLSKMIQKI